MSEPRPALAEDGAPAPVGGLFARAVRVIEITEDLVHLVVWVLLVVIGVLLVVDTARHIAEALAGAPNLQEIVIGILEETLLLFIVAELLHTVAIAVEHRGALDPLPFLVVAMIAAIRSVLVVTAEAETAFQWNPQGIELLILIVLILALAITAVVWRYATRLGAEPLWAAPTVPGAGPDNRQEPRAQDPRGRPGAPSAGGRG
jgi:uncharacterized membrane protein (DUF373 family)